MNTSNGVTVLYVDDEDINLFLFEKSFSSMYNVITALSGEEGLESLKKHSADIIVVISDMRMPGMNGVQFIRTAKKKYENIAYYILTAFEYNAEIQTAMEESIVDEFFTKPFDIEKITAAVEKAVLRFSDN